MLLPLSVTLRAASVLLIADQVPTLNVEPFCRTVAKRATPVADVETCLEGERKARDELAREWSQFTPADKSHCLQLSSLGGDPTYTELLTCLELQRDARRLRAQDRDKPD